jgi:hypothetical protein
MMLGPHATSKKELNCDTLRVEKFVAFHPHLMVLFFLSFPLIIQMAILVKCKEWIKSMMVMFGARLK